MKIGGKTLRVFVLAIFIILLLLAIGVPPFLKARKQKQRNICANNLRHLTSPMVCCVPLSRNLKDGDKMEIKQVCMYLKGSTMPVCPSGGTYIVSWIVGGPTPKCSYHGDLLLDLCHYRTLKDIEEADYRGDAQRTNAPSSPATAGVER